MASNKTKKYVVEILGEPTGALNTNIFRIMVSNGDITSTSISELVDEKLTINGTCAVHVSTDEKEFNMAYFNTLEKGIVHAGGETLFDKSYDNYSAYTDKFIVKKIKCKLGTAYKAVPVLEENTVEDTE